jgi:hypothetical protein
MSRPRVFGGALAQSLLALALLPSATAARTHVTPQDRAATHAYLEAQYEFAKARLAVAPAATAAVEALALRVGRECPGVLAGAPRRRYETIFEEDRGRRTAKQRGEADRLARQLDDLRLELTYALQLPSAELVRQAQLAYATAVRTLRWSSGSLTAFEHAIVAATELPQLGAALNACADMRAWVESGYRRLSTATKAFAAQLAALEFSLFRALRSLRFVVGADALLPYEGTAEKALAVHIASVEAALEPFTSRTRAVQTSAEQTLGLISEAEAEESERPRKGSVEIGQGHTAAGRSYTVYVEPPLRHPRPFARHCEVEVSVRESPSGAGDGQIVIVTGGEQLCLSRSHPPAPKVECEGGLLTIEAQTPPQARSVRLRLSNGRHITTPVALVPASLGGPLGFYYQVVKGPSPIPVSLAELNGAGKVLRLVKLRKTSACVERDAKPPPTVTRTVARGGLPSGERFAIVGERMLGEYPGTDFTAEVESQEPSGDGGLLSAFGVGREVRLRHDPFHQQLQQGCRPSEYAIVFGVLSAPRDTVLARSGGVLRPLTRARIPAVLHVRGVLAYIALPGVPSEIIVRSPSGKTIATERLGAAAREARETCEGEAEGPA